MFPAWSVLLVTPLITQQEVSSLMVEEDIVLTFLIFPVSPSKTENDCDTTTASSSDESRNRTMLLQVGRSDLRLISPDTKQVLLHKSFREISHCACGLHNKECFGFICRESGQSQYLGYIFRCESVGVVEDIMQGLRSAFHNAHEQSKVRQVRSGQVSKII